ncbi:hypothetical protein TNCV_3944401 [Trichonephila clavipes]|nr:hypothetical protein TNCV_3944401 [Trichonephila clavipes]
MTSSEQWRYVKSRGQSCRLRFRGMDSLKLKTCELWVEWSKFSDEQTVPTTTNSCCSDQGSREGSQGKSFGMTSDTPPQEIIDDLRTWNHDRVCHAMTNRRTGMPMPLFLVTLPRSDIKENIYNLTDLCYLKIVVEPLRPKIGPAHCYR